MKDSLSINSQARNLSHGQLSWLEAGRGDAIIILHGIGSAARSFRAQLEGLSERYRVLAWDMPGYGGSAGLGVDAPGVDAYSNALDEWLSSLEIERFHLLGHSLGALVAAHFCAVFPQRIRTLTLASCAIGHARLPALERAKLLASRIDDVQMLGPRQMAEKRGPRLLGPDASPEAMRAVIDVMGEINPRGFSQAARMLSSGDMLAYLATIPISSPIQIVFGTSDVITPPEVNLRAAHARACIDVVTIERAGHALYLEAPKRFNDIVSRFAETAL